MVAAQRVGAKYRQAVQLSTARINAYEGSVRAAKTFTSLLDWLKFIRTAPPGALLMVGRTERTVWRNLVEPLRDLLGPKRVKINRGEGTARICGRLVYVVGANNEQATTKIQGLTLIGAYVDEAATLPESFFNMLYSRLSLAGAQLWLTTNPDGPAHWLLVKWLSNWKLWLDRDGTLRERDVLDEDGNETGVIDLHRFTFTIDDNTTLDPEYVASLKRSYTGLWYRRFIGAEWVAADGAVYDGWDPAKHVIAHDQLPKMREYLALGLDHGMTNATAGILLGIADDFDEYGRRTGSKLYAIDEFWIRKPKDAAGLTVAEQSSALRDWMTANRYDPAWLIVDPAAAAFKVQLATDKVGRLTDADNHVTYGISTVASVLGSGRLLISDRCQHLIEEIPSYSWDDKAAAKGQDAPVKVNDHASDALRYAVATTESSWRALIDY